jgi:hypothetical protein
MASAWLVSHESKAQIARQREINPFTEVNGGDTAPN